MAFSKRKKTEQPAASAAPRTSAAVAAPGVMPPAAAAPRTSASGSHVAPASSHVAPASSHVAPASRFHADTQQSLKHLSRVELLDILVEQARRIERLEAELAHSNKLLAEREIKIDQAGSIAEAALSLNGVFEAADAACRQYLASVQARCAEASAYQAGGGAQLHSESSPYPLSASGQADSASRGVRP